MKISGQLSALAILPAMNRSNAINRIGTPPSVKATGVMLFGKEIIASLHRSGIEASAVDCSANAQSHHVAHRCTDDVTLAAASDIETAHNRAREAAARIRPIALT